MNEKEHEQQPAINELPPYRDLPHEPARRLIKKMVDDDRRTVTRDEQIRNSTNARWAKNLSDMSKETGEDGEPEIR